MDSENKTFVEFRLSEYAQMELADRDVGIDMKRIHFFFIYARSEHILRKKGFARKGKLECMKNEEFGFEFAKGDIRFYLGCRLADMGKAPFTILFVLKPDENTINSRKWENAKKELLSLLMDERLVDIEIKALFDNARKGTPIDRSVFSPIFQKTGNKRQVPERRQTR